REERSRRDGSLRWARRPDGRIEWCGEHHGSCGGFSVATRGHAGTPPPPPSPPRPPPPAPTAPPPAPAAAAAMQAPAPNFTPLVVLFLLLVIAGGVALFLVIKPPLCFPNNL